MYSSILLSTFSIQEKLIKTKKEGRYQLSIYIYNVLQLVVCGLDFLPLHYTCYYDN